MLNERRMRLLLELSRRGSIAEVAAHEYLTPSAVSQQLARLEREAKVPLLERSPRQVRLTNAGRRLAEHAAILAAQIDCAEEEMRAHAGLRAGGIRLGSCPTAGSPLLPDTVSLFVAARPDVEVTFVEAESEDLLVALTSDNVDVALVHSYSTVPHEIPYALKARELSCDALSIVAPSTHPLVVGQEPVEISDLSDCTWIAADAQRALGTALERMCATAGFIPRVRFRTGDPRTMLGLVEAGLGVALLPRSATSARPTTPSVAQVSVKGGLPIRNTLVVYRGSDPNPLIPRMIDAVLTASRHSWSTTAEGSHLHAREREYVAAATL